MKTTYKMLLLLYILGLGVIDNSFTPLGLAAVLMIVGVHTVRERLYDSWYLLGLEFAITSLAIFYTVPVGMWYAALSFDLIQKKFFAGLIPVCICVYVFSLLNDNPALILIISLSVLLALSLTRAESESREHQHTLDKERRLRYSLEEAKQQLLKSQEEIEHITEIQERNRIAREIHDNVGHSIAGILMQMQVAHKYLSLDVNKARTALERSIAKLTEALETLRETVHNLRPSQRLGIEYFKSIIDDYGYCPVDFVHEGDCASLPARFLEVIAATLKESLTNAAKYSKASAIRVELDVNDRFVRLYIRDNGIGCKRIREGLGISGMRERVTNLGGSVSINGDDGFLIVCVLYR